jgi:hypothetical protein
MRLRLLFFATILILSPRAAVGQTAEDSARAVLETARVLERDGRTELARDLLRYLRMRWPGTEAAREAQLRIDVLPATSLTGFGRTSFIAYHTLYGAFLGVAIPAAFDAEGPEPYGAGLLLGVPLGFFGSRAWGRSRPLTDGQAGIVQFGSFWGAWQAVGWRAVFDIGDTTTCDFDVCFIESPSTAPWAAGVLGSVTGLGLGLLAARNPIPGGTSSMIFHSSLWGTFYGLAVGIFADAEDDDLLTATLIGGNAGLLLAIPLAGRWRPTSSRVRIASAGGLAGGLAGLGLVLLFSVDDDQGAIGLTTAGVTAGLILGAALGKDAQDGSGDRLLFAPALLSGQGKLSFGLPVPTPAMLWNPDRSERIRGWKIGVLDLQF